MIDYTKDVHRFGSAGRLKDSHGNSLNVLHAEDADSEKNRRLAWVARVDIAGVASSILATLTIFSS